MSWRVSVVGLGASLLLLAGCASNAEAPVDDMTDAAAQAEVAGADVAPEIQAIPWERPANDAKNLAPEPPSILRDVSLVSDENTFNSPYLPGHRTTMDGRLAVRIQGGPPGTERIARNYSFFLFVPERLEGPIMPGKSGPEILADTTPFDVPFPPAFEEGITRFGHHAICDATTEFPTEGEKPNPYACGPELAHDCYDITLVSATAKTFDAQIWGTPATVEIADPKTVNARILGVELGEPVAGLSVPATNELLEPAITSDGHLLTARLGRAPRDWTNPNTGETIFRQHDLVYYPPNLDFAPCDVRQWTEFHPISHAPYDPRMVGRYGLAAQPFRDSQGALIADGEDLGGTYPWVDREGANVFMSVIPGRMSEQSEERFPRRCVVPGCEDYQENFDWDRGFMVGGLWTHGKLVLLDSMINHLDWAIGISPETHYMVDLFRTPDGEPFSVRLGAGRFIDELRYRGGPFPPGYTHNANILDSIQNLLNQHGNMMPVTPRDVVWLMSNGVATDEVAFDDFLDPNAFIVSNMQASVTQMVDEDGATLSVPIYWNGQKRELTFPLSQAQLNVLHPEEDVEVHVQNAATSPGWKVPAYGLIEAGEGRIEPAALGGIKGKGLWLTGANAVTYAVPAQEQNVLEHDWTLGVFIDRRGDSDERRILATFPDGSLIELVGNSGVRYISDGLVVHDISLPAPAPDAGWLHLGWRLTSGNRAVELLHDGFPFDRFESPSPLFQMSEGDFVVGHRGDENAGFRGWVDELKVLAHDVSPEVACNHAHGTLVRVDSNDTWSGVAARYPDWAHEHVASLTGAPAQARFACFHDYSDDFEAHLANLPDGTVGVREQILFPEGPLLAGAPRPDSTGNGFCLSCHHTEGLGGLSLDALSLDPDTLLEDDPRRQPLQPPRRVFGNIPAHWLPGSPDVATRAPAEGLLIDRWVLETAD